MDERTSSVDLVPDAGWGTGTDQGPTCTEVGVNKLFHKLACVPSGARTSPAAQDKKYQNFLKCSVAKNVVNSRRVVTLQHPLV